MIDLKDTICAPATASGGAIAVIRVSGDDSLAFADSIFTPRSGHASPLASASGYTMHYGSINDGDALVDDVIVSVFRAPHSYTGEDSVEISCHGSRYIVRRILELLVRSGCRMASPGEFTRRAFLAGKMDLSQAEAVADVISSSSEASLRVAQKQLRGAVSSRLAELRDKLLEITSLLELELDFSEEDVEFADRQRLSALVDESVGHISRLAETFSLGNAIKNGIPVAIAGATNTGKSTLLNALLGEDRAIVTDIAGTTRDTVEETFTIDGTLFRFIDTAGIRDTDDKVEKIGIERSLAAISDASIIIGLVAFSENDDEFAAAAHDIIARVDPKNQKLLLFRSKSDLAGTSVTTAAQLSAKIGYQVSDLSALSGFGMDGLRKSLLDAVSATDSGVSPVDGDTTIITNERHYDALCAALSALRRVASGLVSRTPSDLIAEDLRDALRSLGTITGEITTPEVLQNIFSKFCIGK